MTDLDAYEEDILQSVENGEWESKKNINERLLELQSYVKHQNLIQVLIHQFASNKIKYRNMVLMPAKIQTRVEIWI